MEKIIWNESYSVGVKEMDEQHKKLIEIINQLIEAQDEAVHSEKISDILTNMMDYAFYHFKAEENLMREHQYAEYTSHRKTHMGFIRRTAELSSEAVDFAEHVPSETLLFLKNWLLDHILKTDMQYKDFFKEKGLS